MLVEVEVEREKKEGSKRKPVSVERVEKISNGRMNWENKCRINENNEQRKRRKKGKRQK